MIPPPSLPPLPPPPPNKTCVWFFILDQKKFQKIKLTILLRIYEKTCYFINNLLIG